MSAARVHLEPDETLPQPVCLQTAYLSCFLQSHSGRDGAGSGITGALMVGDRTEGR